MCQDTESEGDMQQPASTVNCRPRIPDVRLFDGVNIGLSSGLTVSFALTARLSALGNTEVVIYGGSAELVAGGMSINLGRLPKRQR